MVFVARNKLEDLLRSVNASVEKLQEYAKLTRISADELARATRSASGDREHATNQARIVFDKLNTTVKLKDELEKAVLLATPTKVITPCYLKLQIANNTNDYFIVKNSVVIRNYKIISSVSIVGKSTLGKSIGETFDYEVNGSRIKGKVVDIN